MTTDELIAKTETHTADEMVMIQDQRIRELETKIARQSDRINMLVDRVVELEAELKLLKGE